MYGQVIPRSFLWLVSLCAVLIIGIIGCNEGGGGGGGSFGYEEDDNDWVGTWALETVDGQNWAQFLGEDGANISIITNDWTFYNDGTLEADVVFELEPKGDKVITISNRARGTYTLTDSIYELKFEGTDFFKDSTGTWSSTWSALTLNSDDGTTIVFGKQ
ncbi:hypothetical protein J4G02_20725 [Candidatus Poribacteria bacterium]|nr:hypothetical protein [Candidatus Poribacteria bacterium]